MPDEFTQEDVDKIVADRLKRERTKAEKLLEEAKSASVEDFLSGLDLDREGLKELMEKNTPEQAQEINKLRRELTRAEKRAEELEEAKQSLELATARDKIEFTLTAALSEKCSANQLKLATQVLSDKFEYDGGEVKAKDGKKLGAMVDEFFKENAFMMKPQDTPPPDPKTNPGNPGDPPDKSFKIPYKNKAPDNLIVRED